MRLWLVAVTSLLVALALRVVVDAPADGVHVALLNFLPLIGAGLGKLFGGGGGGDEEEDDGGGGWGSLMKYGLPAGAGAIQGYLGNKATRAAIEQRERESLRGQALTQSTLDPWRGLMHQTQNAGRMERGLTPPTSLGPVPQSRYAAAVPKRQMQLSPQYLAALKKAQAMILAGQGQMPNQLEQANWGATGAQNLS